MKKILLFVILFALPVFAENTAETVYLDLNANETHAYKTSTPKIKDINIKNNDKEEEDYIYHPMEYIKSEARELFLENKKEKSK